MLTSGCPQALSEAGIYALYIDGRMSVTARDKVIEEFRGTDKSVALFLSPMGTTGLNLDCANILIIMVSRRSAMVLLANNL